MALLEIDNLQSRLRHRSRAARRAVDGVSFTIEQGQTLGLVGESGCGKSVTATSILRLVPSPPGKILGGAIRFGGIDILKLRREELPKIRGKDIAMIFQDPMTSLNPVFTVEKQMGEVLSCASAWTGEAARQRSIEMLRDRRHPRPGDAADAPIRTSSPAGMKQRVMIAMALLTEPQLLIADEPTTALDVTVQAQILHLIRELQKRTGASVLFITHDMGVVAEMCDEVAVMYAGRIVEEAPHRRHLQAQPASLHEGPAAQPAAEEPRQEGGAADDRRRGALAAEAAALLPLRGSLLEAQEPARGAAEEVLHRRPAAEAVQEQPRRLPLPA